VVYCVKAGHKRLATYSAHGLEVRRGLVLEVVGVLDLLRSPGSLVGGVVDLRREPLALELGVLLHGLGPWTTARDVIALRVGNGGWDPVSVLLVIPVLGLLGVGVRDGGGLVLEPVLRHSCFLVDNLIGSVLVPVLRLRG